MLDEEHIDWGREKETIQTQGEHNKASSCTSLLKSCRQTLVFYYSMLEIPRVFLYLFVHLLHFKKRAILKAAGDEAWDGRRCHGEEWRAVQAEVSMSAGLFRTPDHTHMTRICLFSGCQRPNLNHLPSVAGSLPVCHTVSSHGCPQMRV